jgi:hypothetical protein
MWPCVELGLTDIWEEHRLTQVLHRATSQNTTFFRLFLISQTEIYFERMTITDDSRDCGKFAGGAMRDPEKGIPGLYPEVATVLGAVHQCRRGVL